MLRSHDEFPCTTFEMSPGDTSLFASVKAGVGERVILYLDGLGRFPGVATQQTPIGFEMSLLLSARRRDRLADQLTWFANRELFDLPEQRRHERFAPMRKDAFLFLPVGHRHPAKIQSMSCSGVAIETNVRPIIGTRVLVCDLAAIVVRHFREGIACEFVETMDLGETEKYKGFKNAASTDSTS